MRSGPCWHLYALIQDFEVNLAVTVALCAIAAYIGGSDAAIRLREVVRRMIELWTTPETWAALLTLTALEIVLGIDNVIFLSVIVRGFRRARPNARGRSGWHWRWCSASCCSACWYG